MKEFDKEEQLDLPTLNNDESFDLSLDQQEQLLMFCETNQDPSMENDWDRSDLDFELLLPEQPESVPDGRSHASLDAVIQEEEIADSYEEDISDDEEGNSGEKSKKQPNWRKSLLIYAHDVLYLLAILIVTSLFLRVVVVSGTSMTNTLKDGDYLLVLSNVFYHDPKQGDIIVASKSTFDDGKPIVKRVIATEGQTVDIDFDLGIVYVDGVAIDEPYTKTPTTLHEGVTFPLVVDEGCIFVLGDNRNGSRDSRYPDIGQIDKKEVIGKVIFLFLPGNNGTDIYGNPNEPRDFKRIGVPD